ncbi:hypothetical protein NM688_g4047 [Phlebia brevispora]|uniref:Uncharacterized protein n=1 Tax=Phlebia brevispora TaxID=194682 RepID=A0ACC1T411_9APHY|nr:hypothetical protein NM688_g4047 [Phlebia brevispora]
MNAAAYSSFPPETLDPGGSADPWPTQHGPSDPGPIERTAHIKAPTRFQPSSRSPPAPACSESSRSPDVGDQAKTTHRVRIIITFSGLWLTLCLHYRGDHKAPSAAVEGEGEGEEAEPADYPRPAAPGTAEPHQHNQHEEEQPKKEKKQGQGAVEHERRLKEDLYRKAEQNRPKKDIPVTKASVAGTRISQPASKIGV